VKDFLIGVLRKFLFRPRSVRARGVSRAVLVDWWTSKALASRRIKVVFVPPAGRRVSRSVAIVQG